VVGDRLFRPPSKRLTAAMSLKRAYDSVETTPVIVPLATEDEAPPTLLLDSVNLLSHGALPADDQRLDGCHESPMKVARRMYVSESSAVSPPTSHKLLSTLTDSMVPGFSEASLQNLNDRASQLEAKIECAAGLLGLSEGLGAENRPRDGYDSRAPLPPAPISRPPLMPLRPVEPRVSAVARRQEALWWTPELLRAAMEFGLPFPSVSRHSWLVRVQTERRQRESENPATQLEQAAGC